MEDSSIYSCNVLDTESRNPHEVTAKITTTEGPHDVFNCIFNWIVKGVLYTKWDVLAETLNITMCANVGLIGGVLPGKSRKFSEYN